MAAVNFKNSMLLRLILLIMLITVGMFAFIAYEVVVTQWKDMIGERVRASRLMAQPLLSSLYKDMIEGRADLARNLMKTLAGVKGVERIQIIRKNGVEMAFQDMKTVISVGKVLGEVRPEWVRGHPHRENVMALGVNQPQFIRALASLRSGGREEVYYREHSDSGDIFTYVTRIKALGRCGACHGADESERGFLMISTSLRRPHMMLMRRMKVWSIYGISGLFVVFFSIFFLLRSMLMKRIRHMIDVSQLWGDGVLTIKMPVKRRDELGFLSECFNSMAGSLKEREDEIDGLYKDAKRSEKEWEETFNSINDIIVIKERDGTVSRANMAAARILKKPLNDIIGRSCHSLFFGKDRPCEPCFLNLTSPDGRAEVCEVTIPGVAGVFLATGHPFAVNDRNEVLSTVVVFTDVTHIKELSRIEMEVERLKDVNEFKSSVISLVSHELRNPLTSIVGYIELLHTRTVSENERDKWLSIVRNQAARMQVLIDNVLELSKTEAGKLEVKMVPADILDVVNSVIVRFNIESGRRMIKVDAADGLPLVDLDVDKISHAFFNLVENALKYSAEETDVLVRLRQKDHRIDISVEDNGIGIPSDYLEKIFEPFQRVQSDEILAIKGIGIGLSICRTIVRLHGGTVWVESELGKGSIFHVELPFIKR